MDKFRYGGVTVFACVGLLLITACGRESADEMSWARAALERNKSLEVVAADQQSRTFTVRLRDTGELRMVRADELVASPSAAAPDTRPSPSAGKTSARTNASPSA